MSNSRLEKFIYAICGMDIDDLPTPLSRIETLWNCLITGETPDFEPLSRNEKYLMSMLNGDVDGLPEPTSRSEKLLYKIATGETDLSDVPGYLSRYEELLKRLIESGGIGGTDFEYVLYTLNDSFSTLYTTAEGPVKSAILKGQTLVNVDSYYNKYSQDFQSSNIDSVSEDGYIQLTANGTWRNAFTKYDGELKPSTKYLVVVDVKTNTLADGTQPFRLFTEGTHFNGVSNVALATGQTEWIGCGVTGVFKYIVTTASDLSNAVVTLRNYISNSVTSGILVYRTMMIEYVEGMENWDIPFFRGMASVKMPVLTTTGKNLLNTDFELGALHWTEGYKIDSTTMIRTTNPINVSGLNSVYVWSEDLNDCRYIFTYDNNMNFLKRITNDGSQINLDNNVAFIHLRTEGTIKSLDHYKNSIVISTSVVVSYELYKTNILTTTSKNLFDMNRPYDNLTDSQATVVQDTNQITVSSAESGIYVNANFILDKDFFAGKTITGSCLYESDEKDIGTVQIAYQDGNGEHHYQWIKTPRTFTFPNSFIGDVMLSISANNTDTPQSNTVTVKNIQLELGSTATSYEPYSEVVLRGIGDVKDTLDGNTGELTQRIGEVVLDGSEDWKSIGTSTNNSDLTRFYTGNLSVIGKNDSLVICDKMTSKVNWNPTVENIYHSNSGYGIVVLKSGLSDVDSFKSWLSQNPLTVQYPLATPTIKTVDLSITDQDGQPTKLNTFNDVTHVSIEAEDLLPTVDLEVPTKIEETLSTLPTLMNDISETQQLLSESIDDQAENINEVSTAITEIRSDIL